MMTVISSKGGGCRNIQIWRATKKWCEQFDKLADRTMVAGGRLLRRSRMRKKREAAMLRFQKHVILEA